MIVIDTQVLSALWLSSPYTLEAEAVLSREPYWIAPTLWRSELRSILSRYLRQNLLSLANAQMVQHEAEQFLLGKEYPVSSAAVLRLTTQCPCSAYECELIALALEKQVPLVTQNRRLQHAFPDQTHSLQQFLQPR
jgi:predicted nucleic acid-binding protein